MRFVLAAVIALPSVLAWNPKACNGVGGCVKGTWNPEGPFRCPDGTRLNTQQTAHNSLGMDNGEYTAISKAEFPSTCLRGVKPKSTDSLAVRTTEFGQKMYVFFSETCTATNPVVGDCYNYDPNPFVSTICQVIDATGKECVMNLKAGECERWGDANNPKCKGWTPAQVEKPSTN
ncbi:hypothetical protein EKO04_005171 [Ascochyta lentis]|uniref:Uncharacterized protein n=1 Tax=Ascochyta lentis TaxID=205686 RepID=A0A8H7J184_9PLEO|nr:hypothetical protein EKO04_005171 [Ascochyta lentis]